MQEHPFERTENPPTPRIIPPAGQRNLLFITINWSAIPGVTSYGVGKWNGSSWVWSYPGNVTSWTDHSVSANTWYIYTVGARNARGWGRSAFNGHGITASTIFSPTPPTYSVHFVADNQIRFSFFKAGATEYEVKKKINGSWSKVQGGTSTEYKETSLAPNTIHE